MCSAMLFPRPRRCWGYDLEVHPVLDVELADLSCEERVKLGRQLQNSLHTIVLLYESGPASASSAKGRLREPSASQIVPSCDSTGAR